MKNTRRTNILLKDKLLRKLDTLIKVQVKSKKQEGQVVQFKEEY